MFLLLLAAILIAFAAGAVTLHVTRDETQSIGPVRLASRAIASHLARDWDDQARVHAYLDRVREVVGLDLRLRTEPSELPRLRAVARRGGDLAVDPEGRIVIPVLRAGEIVGAVEIPMERPGRPHFAQFFRRSS